MADKRRVRYVQRPFIQQGLKPACGTLKEKGFDSVGHSSFYHRGHRD